MTCCGVVMPYAVPSVVRTTREGGLPPLPTKLPAAGANPLCGRRRRGEGRLASPVSALDFVRGEAWTEGIPTWDFQEESWGPSLSEG